MTGKPFVAAASLLAVATAGCSGQTDATVPVFGRATFDGRPMELAIIRSVSETGPKIVAPVEDGHFSLRAGPSSYRVEFAFQEPPALAADDEAAIARLEAEKVASRRRATVSPPPVVSGRYGRSTELTARVEAGGDHTHTFHLTSGR